MTDEETANESSVRSVLCIANGFPKIAKPRRGDMSLLTELLQKLANESINRSPLTGLRSRMI